MARVLIYQNLTMYNKVTVPMAIHLARMGHEVSILANRPTFGGWSFGFSQRYITNNPTSVGVVNPEAVHFIADTIDYRHDFEECADRIGFVNRIRANRYDFIVGTTKNLHRLQELNKEQHCPAFALGYQHLPFFLKVGEPFSGGAEVESPLLQENVFTTHHDWREILAPHGVRLCNFTHLDKVYQRVSEGGGQVGQQVLIFHPGGYRDVVTAPGANKRDSYESQATFLESVCLPLLDVGLQPVVKVHPWRARYHDLEDLRIITADLERRRGLKVGSIQLIGPREWYWDCAIRSAFILSFGSSSLYELWGAGIHKVYVCHFSGTIRSGLFEFFDSIFIKSHAAYRDFLENARYLNRKHDDFTKSIMTSYSDLFDGKACKKAYDLIVGELG